MRIVVGITLLFFCLIALAQTATDVARGSVSGPGFTIALPDSVEMDIAPTSDLAFGINLSENTHGREWDKIPSRYIGVSTKWNVDANSLDQVVNQMIADLPGLVPSELAGEGVLNLASTFPVKLGELPAKRLVLQFSNRKKQPSIKQIVVAYRPRRGANPLVYVASLTTTRNDFQQDLNLFAKLLAGFKLTPTE